MTHTGAESSPSWSRDGRWIYFSSNRTGRYEIWRIPAEGGEEKQVTRKGGYLSFESLDGRSLYYKRSANADALLAQPTAGGEEQTVLECVSGNGYAVVPGGLVHLDCQTTDPSKRAWRRWDARTRQDLKVADLDTGAWIPLGLALSPDGKTLLYTHATLSGDLMMIENFR